MHILICRTIDLPFSKDKTYRFNILEQILFYIESVHNILFQRSFIKNDGFFRFTRATTKILLSNKKGPLTYYRYFKMRKLHSH